MEKLKTIVKAHHNLILYCFLVLAFGVMASSHMYHILVAKSTVPIMDYWQWIAVYGQKVFDGTVTFSDYFNSDAGQHIQPSCMALSFWILKNFHFDVVPLVVIGMILRIVVAGVAMTWFVVHFRKQEKRNDIFMALCAVVIGFAIFNHNQWEITTQPFSLAFIYRIALYYISFYLADRFISHIGLRTAKRNAFCAVLLGLLCAFLTVFVGAAYFVGHLVAIGLAMLWTVYRQRKEFKKYLLPVSIWGVISLASAIVYFVLVSMRGDSSLQTTEFFPLIVMVVKGICYFWGSIFVHQSITNTYGVALVTIVGIVTLIYAVFITVCYMRSNQDGKNVFPLICVFYAFIISAAISVGRVSIFGEVSMTASRYVIESSVGLFGITWMTYDVFSKCKSSTFLKIILLCCIIFAVLGLFAAATIENNIAVYRKAYYEDMREIMLDIENYKDEELTAFQANSPGDIRYCVDFFEKNNLSIFYKPEP